MAGSIRGGSVRTNGQMPTGGGPGRNGSVRLNGRIQEGAKGENSGTSYRGPVSTGKGLSAKGIKSGKVAA